MLLGIDLKQMEKKAWQTYFGDGIWDIYLGLIFIGMGLLAVLEKIGASGLLKYGQFGFLMSIGIILLAIGKRKITIPRLGYVEFGPKRKRNKTLVTILLTISAVFGLVAMVLIMLARDFIPGLFMLLKNPIFMPLFMGGWFALVFGVMAWFLDFSRLYIHAILIGVALALSLYFKIFILLVIVGAIILTIGIIYLIRFMHKYPMIVVGEAKDVE